MTRLPDAGAPVPKRKCYRGSGMSEAPAAERRNEHHCWQLSSPTHSPFADQRNAPFRSTHHSEHEHPPYRRRLYWTPTIAGCDRGTRSAAREAGRSSLHCAPVRLAPFTGPPRNTRRPKRLNSMSVDERSPKRQRRSFSPPSPAAKLAFVATEHPHTPPPSVHMSPTWNAQSSSLQNGGGVTFPTPPSTSGYQGHMTGRGPSSDGGVESGTGTPTDAGELRKDGDGDVKMSGEANAEHRRSDHERSSDATPAAALLGLYKLLSKRKFPMHSAIVCLAHG
jgi:hypothetical protein